MSEIYTPLGTKGNGSLIGTADNDALYGGKGDNHFDAGAGNDTIYLGSAAGDKGTYVDGGAGEDTLVLNGGFARFQQDFEFDAATHTYKLGSLTLKDVEYIDFGDIRLRIEDTSNRAGTQHQSTNGADQLIGNDWGYILDGQQGDDTLIGNGGEDTLYGGKGEDTAVFRGNRADYDIRYDYSSNQYIVTDHQAKRDGSDKLSGIEQLKFADTTIPLHGIYDWGGAPDAATIAKLDGVIEAPPPSPPVEYENLVVLPGTWDPIDLGSVICLPGDIFPVDDVVITATATAMSAALVISDTAADQVVLAGIPAFTVSPAVSYLLDTP